MAALSAPRFSQPEGMEGVRRVDAAKSSSARARDGRESGRGADTAALSFRQSTDFRYKVTTMVPSVTLFG